MDGIKESDSWLQLIKLLLFLCSLGGGTEVICDNNDDQQLKVDKMENNIDSLVRRLTGFVQIQRNFKDLIVLTQGN